MIDATRTAEAVEETSEIWILSCISQMPCEIEQLPTDDCEDHAFHLDVSCEVVLNIKVGLPLYVTPETWHC